MPGDRRPPGTARENAIEGERRPTLGPSFSGRSGYGAIRLTTRHRSFRSGSWVRFGGRRFGLRPEEAKRVIRPRWARLSGDGGREPGLHRGRGTQGCRRETGGSPCQDRPKGSHGIPDRITCSRGPPGQPGGPPRVWARNSQANSGPKQQTAGAVAPAVG